MSTTEGTNADFCREMGIVQVPLSCHRDHSAALAERFDEHKSLHDEWDQEGIPNEMRNISHVVLDILQNLQQGKRHRFAEGSEYVFFSECVFFEVRADNTLDALCVLALTDGTAVGAGAVSRRGKPAREARLLTMYVRPGKRANAGCLEHWFAKLTKAHTLYLDEHGLRCAVPVLSL